MTIDYLRLSELFAEVCDLSAEEQGRVLSERCAHDPELRAELERMLHKDATDGILADARINFGVEGTEPATETLDLPRTIGRYRVKRILGQGGMGIVYLAEQEDPRRDVAVKVIRPGIMHRELFKRFKTESTVLGLLQHPGIAQILEAGTATVSGPHGPSTDQPFFAMEFVDGLPITQYASQNLLNTKQKLELIVHVCQAAQSAHERGIIHRDLKPGNILVTETGQVKLLDFGVARLVDPELKTDTMATQVGQMIGTPAYMSPEQVAGKPNEIDARSDVYSIGVVLFELLSGKLPHLLDVTWHPESIRRAKQAPPQRLSQWNSTLRGDIETIVQTALESDRQRRYESAADLAADIGRYQGQMPIRARPASTWYLVRKFANRHRALVGGIAAVFLALMAGLIGTTWQAGRAIQQRNLAQEQTLRATENAALLRRMIMAATPEEAMGTEPTIRQMLDQASLELRTDTSIHPLVAADTHQVLGDAYYSLGLFDAAQQHIEVAVKLHREHSGSNHENTLYAEMRLAAVLSRRDHDAKAIAMAEDALQRAREHLDPQNETMISLINEMALALSYSTQPDREPVLALHREAYDLSVKIHGPEKLETLRHAMNVGATLMDLGQLDEAEKWLKEVYQTRVKLFSPEHPDTLIAVYNLAALKLHQGNAEEGAELARPHVEVAKKILGDKHFRTINFQLLLAQLEGSMKNWSASEPLIRSALESFSAQFGPVHEDTLKAHGMLAECLIFQDRIQEAETIIKKHRRLCEEHFGAQHPHTVQSATLLFDLAEKRGDADQMEAIAEKFFPGTQWEEPARQMIGEMRKKPR